MAAEVGPKTPQVVVLVGATGDLAQRKLLPGLFHLSKAGFIPDLRIVGVSLDEIGVEAFRGLARKAIDQFFTRQAGEAEWTAFAERLDYVPLSAGAGALAAAVARARDSLGQEGGGRESGTQGGGTRESRCLHYLSVPPAAALTVVRLLAEADLAAGSRIIME